MNPFLWRQMAPRSLLLLACALVALYCPAVSKNIPPVPREAVSANNVSVCKITPQGNPLFFQYITMCK